MGVFAIGCGSLINWMLLYQHAAHDRRHVSHRTTTVVAWPTLTDDYNDKSKKAGAILGVSSSEANKPMVCRRASSFRCLSSTSFSTSSRFLSSPSRLIRHALSFNKGERRRLLA